MWFHSCTCSGHPCVRPCSGLCKPLMVGLPCSHRKPQQARSGSFWALWPWGSLVQAVCKDDPVWRCSGPYRELTNPHQLTSSPRA